MLMDKRELKAIRGFLSVVDESLDGGQDGVTLSERLSELAQIIQRLMHARLGPGSLRTKVHLAILERNARRYQRRIEARLGEEHPAG